jgi:hypothetical protein
MLQIKLKSHVYSANGAWAGTNFDVRAAKGLNFLGGVNHCWHCEVVNNNRTDQSVDMATTVVALTNGTLAVDYQYRITGAGTTEIAVYPLGWWGAESTFAQFSGLISEMTE